MGVKHLARTCSAKPDLLEKLLIACCSMGLLEKKNGTYSNTDLSSKYLVKGKRLYQGDIIAHSASVWNTWHNLENDIHEGKPITEDEDKKHRDFIMGMQNVTLAGRGDLLLENIDLSGRKKLLDVGGGPGTYSILACRKYPALQATIFDAPETTCITKEIIENEDMEERVSVCEGNWDTDEFGSNYDVVLFSNVLHGENSKARMKLEKAYKSMVSGGLLVIQDFLLNNDKTGPLKESLFNIMVGTYSEEELLHEISEAGFLKAKVVVQAEEFGSSWVTAVRP
jgi:predicted O-methyltransferase YrrM